MECQWVVLLLHFHNKKWTALCRRPWRWMGKTHFGPVKSQWMGLNDGFRTGGHNGTGFRTASSFRSDVREEGVDNYNKVILIPMWVKSCDNFSKFLSGVLRRGCSAKAFKEHRWQVWQIIAKEMWSWPYRPCQMLRKVWSARKYNFNSKRCRSTFISSFNPVPQQDVGQSWEIKKSKLILASVGDVSATGWEMVLFWFGRSCLVSFSWKKVRRGQTCSR